MPGTCSALITQRKVFGMSDQDIPAECVSAFLQLLAFTLYEEDRRSGAQAGRAFLSRLDENARGVFEREVLSPRERTICEEFLRFLREGVEEFGDRSAETSLDLFFDSR